MRLQIGYFGKPHGLSGEMRMTISADIGWQPDPGTSFEALNRKKENGPWTITRARKQQGYYLVTLSGITTRDQATWFTNCPVFAEIPRIPKNTFLVRDLIGSTVITDDGRCLGSLVEVLTTPANDVYRIIKDKRELLVPALKNLVQKFDKDNKKLVIHLPDGLEEAYT